MVQTFPYNELEYRVAELENKVRELQSEVIKYQIFFNSSIDAIFLTNPNGQVYQANPAACELFQMTEAEFIEKGRLAIYEKDDEEIIKALDERKSRGHYRGILMHKKKDGTIFPADVSSVLYTDHKGEMKTCTIIRDVSENLRQKEESEKVSLKYQTLFQSFPYGITISDSKGTIIETNIAAEKLLGLAREEHEQRSIYGEEWKIIRTDGSDMPSEEWAGVIALKENRVVSNVEMGFVRADNEVTWLNVSAAPVPIDGYSIAVIYGDITDHHKTQNKLRRLVNDQSKILDNIRAYIYFKDTKNNIIRISQSVADVTGLPKEQIEGKHSKDIYPETADKYWVDDLEVIQSKKEKLGIIEPLPEKDGKNRWLLTDKIPYFDENDTVTGVIVMATDITDLKNYETELQNSRKKFSTIFNNNPAGIVVTSLDDGIILDCNDSFEQISGYSRTEILGKKSLSTSFWVSGERQRSQYVTLLKKVGFFKNLTISFVHKSNELRQGIFSAEVVQFDSISCIITTMFDITELVKTKEQLQETKDHYKILFERSHDAIFVVDTATGRYLEANHAAEVLTGRSRNEIITLTTKDITPDGYNERLEKCRTLSDHPFETLKYVGVHYVRPDGSKREAILTIVAGEGNHAFGIAKDVTDEIKTQKQLQQAQKMEFIGTLAGGIAHDFNNILGSILGYAEMVQEDSPAGSSMKKNIDQVVKASLRAKDLVKQILTFSRQVEDRKIPMQPSLIVKEAITL